MPARGGSTETIAESVRKTPSARSTTAANAGSDDVYRAECTTTINAAEPWPEKCCWIIPRASTD